MERTARLGLTGLALVAAAAALVHVSAVVPCIQDDGFIYFRIAENAAQGRGPVFNPGERVDAATSPLWTWMLAAAAGCGVEPRTAASVLAILAGLAAVVASGRWALELANPHGRSATALALAAPALFALDARVWLAALSGMETALAACTWVIAARALVRTCMQREAVRATGWWLLAAVLARAEFALFALSIAGYALLRRRLGFAALVRVLAPALVAGTAYLVAHTLYFGDPLPNTFYAKRAADWAHARIGLAWLAGAPRSYPWLAMAGLAAILPWKRDVTIPIAFGLLGYAFFLVLLGGDHFVFHRPFVHALPTALAVLGGLAGHLAARGGRRARAATAVVLAALVGFAATRRVAPGAFQWVRQAAQLGYALARTYPPDTRLGLFAIGAIGYTSRLPVVDALGLADAHIARQRAPGHEIGPADIGHERGNPQDVLERADVIVLFGAYAPIPFESLEEVRAGFGSHARFLGEARAALARGVFRLRNIEFAPGAYWAVLERNS